MYNLWTRLRLIWWSGHSDHPQLQWSPDIFSHAALITEPKFRGWLIEDMTTAHLQLCVRVLGNSQWLKKRDHLPASGDTGWSCPLELTCPPDPIYNEMTSSIGTSVKLVPGRSEHFQHTPWSWWVSRHGYVFDKDAQQYKPVILWIGVQQYNAC